MQSQQRTLHPGLAGSRTGCVSHALRTAPPPYLAGADDPHHLATPCIWWGSSFGEQGEVGVGAAASAGGECGSCCASLAAAVHPCRRRSHGCQNNTPARQLNLVLTAQTAAGSRPPTALRRQPPRRAAWWVVRWVVPLLPPPLPRVGPGPGPPGSRLDGFWASPCCALAAAGERQESGKYRAGRGASLEGRRCLLGGGRGSSCDRGSTDGRWRAADCHQAAAAPSRPVAPSARAACSMCPASIA